MTTGARPAAGRPEFDQSLLRLYSDLGRAHTYRSIVDALQPELERMLGYKSVWMQVVREGSDDLLTLDSGGPVIDVMKRLLQDERFRQRLHGEEFVVVPIGDDPWLHEIMSYGDVHVTADARTHPLTNKDLIALTGQRSVVCVPLMLAERTLGWLNLGTFYDEGVLVPDEGGVDYLRRLSNHVAVALDRVRFLGERREAEEALKRSLDQLEFSGFLLDRVMDGILVRDTEELTVLYANDAMCRLAGVPREELLASADYDWVRAEDRDALRRCMEGVARTGEGQTEIMPEADHGKALELRSSIVEYMGRRAFLSVVSDISERKTAQATIEYMALHDPLTDLANRTLLADRLEQAVAHARRSRQPLALVFLDVDNFKLINDSAGHGAGDLLLQEIARRLREMVRADDTVARFGGDEFTLVLQDVGTAEQARLVAEKVLASFREPFELPGGRVSVTASLGVVTYECDGATVADLMRNADVAMYSAKESGRNSVRLYEPSMNERMAERFALRHDLEHAVAQRMLHLHFQPIVRLTDNEIVGVEALCRWTHPELGPITPAEFIPLAEESGAIHELDRWVLGQACRQAADWQRPGHELSVSVNISAHRLSDVDLVASVQEALDDSGLPAGLLQLEITETTAMHDAPYLMGALRELREMGVRIAIDDFGTGYSSLDYLMRFPVDVLKVDRVFVQDVCYDPGCLAIAYAVVSLGRAFGLDVIAEGIETEEQRQALHGISYAVGQGYLFSAPVPAEEFASLLVLGTARAESA